MANIIVSPLRVPRVARNGRIYTGNISLSQSGAGGAAVNLDWVSVTEDLVTINRDLHVTGNISASQEVIAWIAGAVESDVLANLTASAPLRKSTDSNIVLDFNTTQFEVNVSNQLQIKAGVLTPAEHTHDASDVISGIFDVARIPDLAISKITGLQTALNNKIETSLIGSVNGIAELDGSGKVLSAQLPSYVDDVLEYSSTATFPATGESGKIYIAQDTNLSYRWTGTGYAEISPSIALGETSSTAYRGDRGKIAYDHSQVITGNPHQIGIADLTDGSNVAKLTGATFSNNVVVDAGTGFSYVANRREYNLKDYLARLNNSGGLTYLVNYNETDVTVEGGVRVGLTTFQYSQDLVTWRDIYHTGNDGNLWKLNAANTTSVTQNVQKFISSTGTNRSWLEVTNTGGNLLLGLHGSAADGLLVGAIAYSGIIGTSGNYPISFGTNSAIRATLHSDGLNLKTGSYQINGTTVIDSGRNLSVASGTFTGTLEQNHGGSIFRIRGGTTTALPTYSDIAGEYPFIYHTAGTGTRALTIGVADDGAIANYIHLYEGNNPSTAFTSFWINGAERVRLTASGALLSVGEISTRSKYELRNATGDLKWSFELSGDDLVVKNSAGTIRGKIDQTGNLSVEGEVTAFATL